MNVKKRLFTITILVLIYTKILISSTDGITENKPLSRKRSSDSIEKITDTTDTESEKNKKFKIENVEPKQLTDLGQSLIGSQIYSFLNAKERTNVRLLSQFFHQNFDDLHFNPYKILFPILNDRERELNGKLIDGSYMTFVSENKSDPQIISTNFSPTYNYFENTGYKLTKNHWTVSNLNLRSCYGTQNFKLDLSVGHGAVEIHDSHLLDEQVTDLQVGDWIIINNKDLILAQIVDDTNIRNTIDQLVESYKPGIDFYVKAFETDKKGFKKFIIGEINCAQDDETRFRCGDYWISSDMFKNFTKVNKIVKILNIVKDNYKFQITCVDMVKTKSEGRSYLNSKFAHHVDLNSVNIHFKPQENKIIVSIKNEEFTTLENPNYLQFIMNPHEYNFYLKFD